MAYVAPRYPVPRKVTLGRAAPEGGVTPAIAGSGWVLGYGIVTPVFSALTGGACSRRGGGAPGGPVPVSNTIRRARYGATAGGRYRVHRSTPGRRQWLSLRAGAPPLHPRWTGCRLFSVTRKWGARPDLHTDR